MAPTGYTNVLLIVADDLGVGDLGAYGNPYASTSHLDRLAAEGVRLTQHYSASPCSAAARASLLTGRYSHRTGALGTEANRGLDRFSVQETTLADLFRAAGYATGLVGKWHNGCFDRRYHPHARGFEEFVGFLNDTMDYYNWTLDANGQPRHADGRYLTDVFTDEAVGFITRHRQHPFFLTVAYNAPHRPLQAPEPEVRAFRQTGRFNEALSRLYAMIHRMDAGVGHILDTLAEHDLDANTVVLFTGDNGPWLGEERLEDGRLFSLRRPNGPFRGMKPDVLEGGIRVPALLRWPAGLPAGSVCDTLVHFCDWFPTLLTAARITARPPRPLDGVDVLPLLRGGTVAAYPPRFWQFNRYTPVPDCNAAMRDGPWKLVWPPIPEALAAVPVDTVWVRGMSAAPPFEMAIDRSPVVRELPPPGAPELYRIDEDPGETENLADRHPTQVVQMQRALTHWFEAVNAERAALPDVWMGGDAS